MLAAAVFVVVTKCCCSQMYMFNPFDENQMGEMEDMPGVVERGALRGQAAEQLAVYDHSGFPEFGLFTLHDPSTL